jgi:hypothetical protein
LAAPDLEGSFASNNIFILVPRNAMSTAELLYCAGVLNSWVATLYFRSIQPRVGKLFAEVKITHLEEIPIAFFAQELAREYGNRFAIASEPQAVLRSLGEALRERTREVAPHLAELIEEPHEQVPTDA